MISGMQVTKALDSLAFLRSRAIADSMYRSMLERTNEQLSYSWAPMSAAIGLLGVLFAAGAIVGAYLLYRQSADYQKKLDNTIAEYRALIDELVEDGRTRMAALAETVTAQIEAASKEIEEVGADRKRIATEIQRLNEVRDAVTAATAPPASDPRYRPIPGFEGLGLDSIRRGMQIGRAGAGNAAREALVRTVKASREAEALVREEEAEAKKKL